MLSYSIADAMDSLYLYSTMQANCGNLDDWNRIRRLKVGSETPIAAAICQRYTPAFFAHSRTSKLAFTLIISKTS